MSAADTFRVWAAGAVVWGSTMCEAPGCLRPAAVLAELDERRGEGVPVCLDDADRLLERWVATDLRRGLELPDPWEDQRPSVRRHVPGPSEWEHADRTPEKWLAEQQGVDTSNPDWDVPF